MSLTLVSPPSSDKQRVTATTLPVGLLMNALLGRKEGVSIGGPDRITPLPPLMGCDTNKISDGVKIYGNYTRYKKVPKIVTIGLGDGQTVLTFSYLKRRWPETYKALLIFNGHWHSSGHHQLCTVTMLAWKAFYGGLADRLERTPVEGGRKVRARCMPHHIPCP